MYNIQLQHKPGAQLIGADMMSRRPDHIKAEDPVQTMFPTAKFIGGTLIQLVDNAEIKEAQEQDLFSRSLIANLRSSKKQTPIKPEWTLEEDLLQHFKRIYVPNDIKLRQKIISQFHDLPQFGHPGTFRTLALVRTYYSWPRMGTTIARYIQGCAPCAQMKINTHPTVPPIQPIKAKTDAQPFSTVTLDFITDLPQSDSFDSLLVAVDHDVTKAIILMPCNKTINAMETAELYLNQVFRRFGLPKTVRTGSLPCRSSFLFQTTL